MSITTTDVTTAVGNVYVSSGNTAITFLSLCNYSASNVTANVHVVPSGSTANSINQILASIPITTLDTFQLYVTGEKLVLSNGDSVQVSASGNSSISALTSYTSL
jgi:hypothetical protein